MCEERVRLWVATKRERLESRVLARNPAQLSGARRVTEPKKVVPDRLGLSKPRTADLHPSYHSSFPSSPDFR